MKKVFNFYFMIFCLIGFFTVNVESTSAAPSATIKLTTIETEVLKENRQEKIISLSKATPIIVLSETEGWTKIQYKTVIGFIKSEYLKSVSPQYMLVKSQNEPLVRVTNKQHSGSIGKLYLNSIVELYGSNSTDFVFIKYGGLAGYVNKHALIKPTGKKMKVKASKDLVVRSIASSSSDDIGTLRKNSNVTMLTNLKGWAFVTSESLSGYVPMSGLTTPVQKAVPPKPSKPKSAQPVKGKKIALTFDDGPHPKVTRQILQTLDKYNAKATFFVIGQEVVKYPEVLKEVYEAGHEIGNHTYNHEKLTTLSQKEVNHQIQSTDELIKSVIGKNATVFRPPYGSYDETVIKQLKVPSVMWTIDTLDWKHRDPEKTALAIEEQVNNGSIILMHDIHQATADALETILIDLQIQGYTFVTVSELLKK
ncbi:polysaccharide deacetylase family protein [Solibacillus sp. FSL K6-4121]|uniref:polysaccharide deacetylase family protein n=1 Tax=Solibacillus sp. FSL K6-4121 TaxID=2921505 RepID=UPI0030F75375